MASTLTVDNIVGATAAAKVHITGHVVQVVSASYSTQVVNSSNVLADTGLTATISPISANSKILVVVHQNGGYKSTGAAGSGINLILKRGSTTISTISSATGYSNQNINFYPATVSIGYLDSPATTSATTYKTKFRNDANSSQVRFQISSTVSTMTLMEISQ